MAVFEETIDLKGNIATEAKSAAAQMKILASAVKATQAAMVKASATGNVGQVKKLTKDLNSLQSAISAVPPQSASMASGLKGMTSGIDGAQAELAEMTGGLSIVVEALAAVGAAFGAVVVAGAAMAIEAVEAKEKMLSLFDALGEGKVTGKQTVAMLDELGDSIGQTRKQLAPLAQSFLTLGITGTDQLRALTLAAASAGALADGGAEKFATMFGVINAAAEAGQKLSIPFKKLEKQLVGVGLNIGDMAKQMGMTEQALTSGLKAGTVDAKKFGDALTAAATNKGAGPLAKAGAAIGNIWAKATESVSKMFEDIEVGPFLGEIKSMFDILGQAQPSGQALKSGIGGFFKEVFATATKVVPMVKHFLLDLVILGLRAYIALKPVIKTIKEFAASSAAQVAIDGLLVAFKAIGVAVVAVVALFGALVAVAVVMSAAFGALLGGIISFGSAIGEFIAGAAAALVDWVASAATTATDFVSGLVKGVTSGASMVVDAVKGLAKGASDAFKSALGIHSPSKVMMQMGGHVAGGAAEGIAGGVPDVHAASRDLAGAAAGGFASGGSASGGAAGGKGGVSVNVEAGAIVINGAGKSAEELSESMLSMIFERIALSQGL